MSKILTFGGYALTVGNHAVAASAVNPPEPPEPLPANTVRVRANDGNAPIKVEETTYETATLVPGTSDVYDVYKSGTDFRNLLRGSSNVIEVLGSNTSNVTDMYGMFDGCSALNSVPLLDTSKVTNMAYMFRDCLNVESGALALYQQASSQTTPPATYFHAFKNCGSNTVTGAAELAQIPRIWGGTA